MRATLFILVLVGIAVWWGNKPSPSGIRLTTPIVPTSIRRVPQAPLPTNRPSSQDWNGPNPNAPQSTEGLAGYYDVRTHVPGGKYSPRF